VLQGSVLGPVLYLLYITDLPITLGSTTYVEDTAVLAAYNNHIEASSKLQENLYQIQRWFEKWRFKANGTKSILVIFTTQRETCPPVILNGQKIPQADDTKYLGLSLDRRLN